MAISGSRMFRQYRDLFIRRDSIMSDRRKILIHRDRLIEVFDASLGGLRLPMRLRKRSGGLLAWRNIALRGRDQRDHDLVFYEDGLRRLPQVVRQELLELDKRRILLNLNLSLLQHESIQLNRALIKIDANTRIIESMAS